MTAVSRGWFPAAALSRGIQPPEPCPRDCGCPAGAGHQCGR